MMSMFLFALNADVPRPLRFSWQVEWLTGSDLCALEAENECASLLQSWKKPVNSSSVLCYFSLNGGAPAPLSLLLLLISLQQTCNKSYEQE